MNSEAALGNEKPLSEAVAVLNDVIRLSKEKKAAKKVLDDIEEKYTAAKEKVKDLFINMGVKSMRCGDRNVYISKTIFAGINEGVERDKLASALIALSMDDYITCNAQKLSSYVREIIQQHPDFMDSEGNVIATPDEIAAVLPEPFNKMIRVSEKMDIGVRK